MLKESLGNTDLLKLPKTAFLCSSKIPASAVLKCYDWAIAQREAGNCVVCSNHSALEKDVFKILLRGTQPLILVLPRTLKKKWEPEISKALEEQRLLIISPFNKNEDRITRETAYVKNETIFKIADKVVIGHASPGGQLSKLSAGNENVSFL